MAKPRAEVRNFGLRAEVGNMMVDYARQEDEFLAKTRQPKETRKPKVSGQITERGDQIATRIRDGTYQEGVLLAEHVAKPKEISRKHKMDLDQQQRELKKAKHDDDEIASLKTLNEKIQAELDEWQMDHKKQQERLRDQSKRLKALEVDKEDLSKLVENSNDTIKKMQDIVQQKTELVSATQENFDKAMEMVEVSRKANKALQDDLRKAHKARKAAENHAFWVKCHEKLKRLCELYAPRSDA